MSQGAIFNLVNTDQRFDQYFTASYYLRARLDAIRARRAREGAAVVQPTFADLARTHVVYIHGAYRPYVATASEYTRVKPTGDGVGSLGPSRGVLQFTFPIFGHFTSDMALHIRIKALGSPTATAATPAAPYYRFCSLPGVRILRRVEFKSDAVVIDDYTPDEVIAYSKFFVQSDQRAGWERCMGQQELREADFYANGYTGVMLYRDGPQTPKLYHEDLDLFIPLQFDMCRDASRALVNDLISNSQRTITVELASIGEIVQALLPVAGPAPPQSPTLVTAPLAPTGFVATPLPISRLPLEASLYVNSLYVNPEIHDIFASRIGFSLIRVHRRETKQLQAPAANILLNNLKYPSEYLLVGIRSRALANDFDRWWLMGFPAQRADSNKLLVPAMIWNPNVLQCQLVCREGVESTSLESGVATLGVTAHGITIYPDLPAGFYNAYAPIRYTDNTFVVSPRDNSAFLVTFCLYPGKYDVSGYYNLSSGREMYLSYRLKDSYASAFQAGGAEIVISMSALNFLMRRGDKVALRYAM